MANLYEKAGVNLTEAKKLNERLSNELGISAFAGKNFLAEGLNIVTCCDGIGSKIIPLYEKKMYKTIAQDLIAANLNDLVCCGATAIGFIDYLAVNKLDSDAVFEIIRYLAEGLKSCGCKLLGGETSEISELITEKNIDISGFAVGLLKQENTLNKKNVYKDDVILGLCSSGVHANGFSLIRKFFKDGKLSADDFNTALEPTEIYYNQVYKLVEKGLIKSCANITGGGIFANLTRAIPENLYAKLYLEKIPQQQIFVKLKQLCPEEFYDVFNAGVGFCLIAERKNINEIFEICKDFNPFELGVITEKGTK